MKTARFLLSYIGPKLYIDKAYPNFLKRGLGLLIYVGALKIYIESFYHPIASVK